MVIVSRLQRSLYQQSGLQGIEKTLKYVLVIYTVLQTPVIIGLALVCLPDKFALDGRVIEIKACIISLLLGLWAIFGIGLIKAL